MIDELLSNLSADTLEAIRSDLYERWITSIRDRGSAEFSHKLCCFLDDVTDELSVRAANILDKRATV